MTLFVALSIKFYPAAWRGGDADNAATHWHEMSQLNIHIWLFCDETQRNIAGVLSPVHCALLRSCSGQITPPLTDVSIHNYVTQHHHPWYCHTAVCRTWPHLWKRVPPVLLFSCHDQHTECTLCWGPHVRRYFWYLASNLQSDDTKVTDQRGGLQGGSLFAPDYWPWTHAPLPCCCIHPFSSLFWLKPDSWNRDRIYSNECYISFKISFR